MAPNGMHGLDEPLQPPNLPPPGLLRRFGPYLLLAVAFALLALVWQSLCRDDKCYTIEGTTVKNGADGKLEGTFEVKKSLWGIQTDGTGGACLLLDYREFKLPPIGMWKFALAPGGEKLACSKNEDCGGNILSKDKLDAQFGATSPLVRLFRGWESVCDEDLGTCWVRPGTGDKNDPPQPDPKSVDPIAPLEHLCNKGVSVSPTHHYPFFALAPPFDLATLDDQVWKDDWTEKQVWARLGLCLTGYYAPTGAKTVCASRPLAPSNQVLIKR